MHDPGSKNRFSKLSYVERTAVALSARWQTIRSLLSLSYPLPLLPFIRGLVIANRYHDIRSGKGSEYIVPGNLSVSFTARYFWVRSYEQKGGRKLYRVYIARWTSTTFFVREWDPPPTKLLPWLFPLAGELGTGLEESVFRLNAENSFRAYTRCLPNTSSFSVIPMPFLYTYCRSSHCASHERIRGMKICNELPDRKLSSVRSAK